LDSIWTRFETEPGRCETPFFILGDVLQGMKKLYRAPLDYLEEVTTGMADTVFVNSGFTKEVTVVFAYRDVMVLKFISVY
jgi:hypothetical protein